MASRWADAVLNAVRASGRTYFWQTLETVDKRYAAVGPSGSGSGDGLVPAAMRGKRKHAKASLKAGGAGRSATAKATAANSRATRDPVHQSVAPESGLAKRRGRPPGTGKNQI